ncbi:hypothetical protein Q0F98_10655 [Paenibacillus amylolyticus]|nr:hypothetical protein Q0F98_10655 [Paenibacillus amylolyticus]
MQWTAMEEKASEVTLAVDRSETFQHFRTLNGISLDDTMDNMLAKKGQPGHKQEDPYLGCPEYHFHDVKVGLCEDTDVIQYVHIDASENHIMLNGKRIEMNIGSDPSCSRETVLCGRGRRSVSPWRPGSEGIYEVRISAD